MFAWLNKRKKKNSQTVRSVMPDDLLLGLQKIYIRSTIHSLEGNAGGIVHNIQRCTQIEVLNFLYKIDSLYVNN